MKFIRFQDLSDKKELTITVTVPYRVDLHPMVILLWVLCREESNYITLLMLSNGSIQVIIVLTYMDWILVLILSIY